MTHVITGRNEVVAKVMFLQVSVILSTGGGLRRTPPDQADPPRDQGEPPPRTKENPPRPGRPPPGSRRTPPDQADPPRSRRTPPPREEDCSIRSTVNERPVRILLECNLVFIFNLCHGNILIHYAILWHLFFLLRHSKYTIQGGIKENITADIADFFI